MAARWKAASSEPPSLKELQSDKLCDSNIKTGIIHAGEWNFDPDQKLRILRENNNNTETQLAKQPTVLSSKTGWTEWNIWKIIAQMAELCRKIVKMETQMDEMELEICESDISQR